MIEVWFSDRSAIFDIGKSQLIQKVLLLEYWNFPWAMPRYMRVCLPNFITIGEILSELAGMKNYRDRMRFSSAVSVDVKNNELTTDVTLCWNREIRINYNTSINKLTLEIKIIWRKSFMP